ncbi:MAG TPA: peptidase S1 [Ruminococcus sp.]|nr:peptidase S1 [Ruminococcus sp.]
MLDNNFGNGSQENTNDNPVTPVEPVSAPQQTLTPAEEVQPVKDPFLGAAEQAAKNPQPQSSGSYYSPRSGESGSFIPPVNNNGGGGQTPPEQPKQKRSHKGLRALGMFAAVAFISYAAIQCYQFATENETLRRFLGKDSDSENRISLQTGETESASTEAASTQANQNSDTLSTVNAQHWIDLAARENAMTIPDIVDKVTPATVGVASTFVRQGQTFSMWGFGGGETYEQEVPATGTGIIMSEDGYIITNAHVIYDSSEQYHMGEAKAVQVVLNEDYYEGETTLDAQIIAYDVAEDIAVLKVNTTQDLTVAEFGNSDDLRVGELVVAIGNPLGFDLFGSVTTGIVSALNREVAINDSTMRLIQTDTAINAGNSGGPLINSYGQVIGINSSKISSSYYDEASVEGLCFAIPIKHASEVVNDLINYGYVTGKPLIGISGRPVTEEISQAYGLPIGVYVQSVVKGSAADLAGIKVGDIIIAINDKAISDYDELNSEKDQYKAGDTITLTVTRGDQDLTFTLVLQEKKPSSAN